MKRFCSAIAACALALPLAAEETTTSSEGDGFKRGYIVVCYYGALSQDRRRIGRLKEGDSDFLLNGTTDTMPVAKIPVFYVDESADREDVHAACINAREQEPFDKSYKVRAAYAAKGMHSRTYYLLMFGEEGAQDLYLSGLKRSFW